MFAEAARLLGEPTSAYLTADDMPVGAPSPAVLWSRLQLVRAVVAQRKPSMETASLVLRILDGEKIADLVDDASHIGAAG